MTDWAKEGGLLNLNWNPLRSGPWTTMTKDDDRIVMCTEPGPGCIFSVLFFWALPCFISEMKADRFVFTVTETGEVLCEVRCKRACGELPVRQLTGVTAAVIHESNFSANGSPQPYTPSVFFICHSQGQYRALEASGTFDRNLRDISDSINNMIQSRRRIAEPITIHDPESYFSENNVVSTMAIPSTAAATARIAYIANLSYNITSNMITTVTAADSEQLFPNTPNQQYSRVPRQVNFGSHSIGEPPEYEI